MEILYMYTYMYSTVGVYAYDLMICQFACVPNSQQKDVVSITVTTLAWSEKKRMPRHTHTCVYIYMYTHANVCKCMGLWIGIYTHTYCVYTCTYRMYSFFYFNHFTGSWRISVGVSAHSLAASSFLDYTRKSQTQHLSPCWLTVAQYHTDWSNRDYPIAIHDANPSLSTN